MADITNLTNFLTDVANAIRTKKELEETEKIAAEDFDTEILSIQTKEDLDEVLTAQETLITQLKEQVTQLEEDVKNKTKSEAKLNLYVQEDEPSSKDGIWLKTNKEYEEVISSSLYDIEIGQGLSSVYTNLPLYDTGVTAIDDTCYLFGFITDGSTSQEGTATNVAYKYNTRTNVFTQLASPTYRPNQYCVVSVKGMIYYYSGTRLIQYNPINNEYIQINTAPITPYKLLTNGSDLYLIRNSAGTNGNSVYKYDISSGEYSLLGNFTAHGSNTGVYALLNNKIYFMGGINGWGLTPMTTVYYLDLDTLTFTSAGFQIGYGSSTYSSSLLEWTDCTVANNKIYCFGGLGSSGKGVNAGMIIVDPNSKTQSVKTMPISGCEVICCTVKDNECYVMGYTITNGDGPKQKKWFTYADSIRKEEATIPENNAIIIAPGVRYETTAFDSEVVNKLKWNFNDVQFYDKDLGTYDTSIERYYGDGEEWVKIN